MSCILTTHYYTTQHTLQHSSRHVDNLTYRVGDASHFSEPTTCQGGITRHETDWLAGDHSGRQQNGEISTFSFKQNNTVMQFQPGNDYIIYSIWELLVSYYW